MARSNYNRYQYETSPRKLEPYYTPRIKQVDNKKEKTKKAQYAKKQKEARKLKRKVIMYLAIAFTIVFGISYRNAQIDENFDKVQDLKSELAAVEKENAQLEVSIESSLNLTNLEQQARSMLGMQKLTNKQTEYINLPKTDYIEAASEQVIIEEKPGLLETIGNYIAQLFK